MDGGLMIFMMDMIFFRSDIPPVLEFWKWRSSARRYGLDLGPRVAPYIISL